MTVSRAEDIAAALRRCRADWLPRLFPGGRIANGTFYLGDADGGAGRSLAIPLNPERAETIRDFAGDFSGDDLDLFARGQHLELKDAMVEAARMLGLDGTPAAKRNGHVPGRANASSSGAEQLDLMPTGFPPFDLRDQLRRLRVIQRRGDGDVLRDTRGTEHAVVDVIRYDIRDRQGRLVYVDARITYGWQEKKGRPDKTHRPLTLWRRADGVLEWRVGGYKKAQPLYGLETLDVAAGVPVVVHEGPGKADRGRALAPQFVHLALVGGAKRIEQTDWSPLAGRIVVLWLDADQAGADATEAIRRKLSAVGASSVAVVTPPAGVPEGWAIDDLADQATGDDVDALVSAALDDAEAVPPPPLPNGFRLLSLEDLDRLTPPDWLLQGLLPEGSLGLIYGPPRNFKSFVALAWGLSVAYGVEWFGRVAKRGAVVYVAAEGAAGYKKRVRAWRVENRVEDEPAPFLVIPHAVGLVDPKGEDVQGLLAVLRAVELREGVPVVLVIIDTLARCFVGGDEDRAGDMGGAIRSADLVREKTGAAVLLVHHSGKDTERGPRGSSSLTGAVDAAFEVTRDPERPRLVVKTVKQKDEDEAEPIALDAVSLDVTDRATGEVTSSVVLRLGTSAEARRRPPTGRAKFALETLHNLMADAGHPAPPDMSGRCPAGTRVMKVAEWREAFTSRSVEGERPDTVAKAFRRSVETLQHAGLVGVWGDYCWLVKHDDN